MGFIFYLKKEFCKYAAFNIESATRIRLLVISSIRKRVNVSKSSVDNMDLT